MSKIAYSNQPIKSFGGFHFLFGLFRRHSIDNLIDKFLGDRAVNSCHAYSDVLLGFFSTFLAGGNCLEDMNRMRQELNEVKGARISSADTLARVLRDLSCEGRKVTNGAGGENTLVDNDLLNDMLVGMAGLNLKSEIDPILDIDAHILNCDKKDGEYTYNKLKGYAPMAAFINRIPVRIQNRSGNTSPNFGHVEFVESLLPDLDKQGIAVKYFRADAASFQWELMELLDRRNIFFYIRAKNSNSLLQKVKALAPDQWKKGCVGKASLETTELIYKGYRLVVQRSPRKNGQLDIFENSPYTYRAIITNDTRSCMEATDVILFYNNRGDSEKNFDILQNDFGWAKMPLDNISVNTSYLLVTAFFMSLFEWIKSRMSALSRMVNTGMRTKAFLLNFLSIPAKVKYRSRQRIITFFTSIRFGKLEELLI